MPIINHNYYGVYKLNIYFYSYINFLNNWWLGLLVLVICVVLINIFFKDEEKKENTFLCIVTDLTKFFLAIIILISVIVFCSFSIDHSEYNKIYRINNDMTGNEYSEEQRHEMKNLIDIATKNGSITNYELSLIEDKKQKYDDLNAIKKLREDVGI